MEEKQQDTLAEIIKHATADPKVLSQRELAARAGVSNTTISRIVKGQKPGPETLKKLAPYLGRSYNELMVIEGYISEAMQHRVQTAAGIAYLPVLGTIRGGEPMLADENIIGYLPTDSAHVSNGEYYYLRVDGDSMAPRIEPEDLVLVRVAQECDAGTIAVVLVGDEDVALKRVYYKDNLIMLHSDNRAYDPRLVRADDVQVIGCVKKIIKDAT